MIRRVCCLIVFLIPWIYGWTQIPLNQHKYLDSLVSVLKQHTSDSIKARTSFLLAEYWSAKDSVKAEAYLDRGRKLSEKYPYLQGIRYYFEAVFQSDREKSEAIYLKADSLLKKFSTPDAYLFRSKVWRRIGFLKQLDDDEKAFTDVLVNKAIPFAEQSGDQSLVGDHYLAMGIVFKNKRQLEKSEKYCLRAIGILRGVHAEPGLLAKAYVTNAENYVFLETYPKAKAMLDSAYVLLAPFPASEHFLRYYMIEGMYFTVVRSPAKALASLDKGVALAKKLALSYDEQSLIFQKFYVYYENGDYGKAKEVLQQLLHRKEFMSLLVNRLQIYEGLAETNVKLKDMSSAYSWLKQYSLLSDSLNASKLKNDIHALEVKFRNAENEKKISELKAENDRAILEARSNRLFNWLLGLLSLFLLLVSVFSFWYYRNNRKLSEQKELNYQQQLKEVEQQRQLAYSSALLEGEEKERRRLARDLHDGLGGLLANVKIHLSGLEAKSDAEVIVDDLGGIINEVDGSLTELRRIAHNMMPMALIKFGLEIALEDLCDFFRNEVTYITFQAFSVQKDIPEQVQVSIYRIIQELLTNAVRHGKASNIVLQCSQNENRFFITMEDNGKGFDKGVLATKKGIGLSNIESRVSFLKGSLEIDSIVNEGTSVNIELPVR
ncbi:histidine kinase [Olivibacter sp. CPCC 100613]|uniref:sensor histidine kinase n=1 Tax=Olivibacter sp. CPCC 100613 TaxID=3079931 RepID=UPI002FF6995B